MPVMDLPTMMQDLGFDDAVVQLVRDTLDTSRAEVENASDLHPVGGRSFGDLPEALELAEHTRQARETVVEALQEMVTGLAGYRDAVTKMVQETREVEQDAISSLRRLEQAQSCVVTPSFSAPNECAPSTPATTEGE